MNEKNCCVLNSGEAAWFFEPYARRLSQALGCEISVTPRSFNYMLGFDTSELSTLGKTFVPIESLRLAADKRLLAKVFSDKGIPIPETHLLSRDRVRQFLGTHSQKEWCVKYPLSCGAAGHKVILSEGDVPYNYPEPYVIQEFIRLEEPKVYRTYGFCGKIAGWNVRKFPPSSKAKSPWVAHAMGARYEHLREVPVGVKTIAPQALQAVGLQKSYGCVDLLQRPTGEWVVLEVGTDGIYTHVDCDLGNESVEEALFTNIREAFWCWYSTARED